jgi:probable F420-dependent oxidoreductase
MRIGVTLFATDRTIRPDELAAEAEARGFESLYLPEHTHIPTSRLTPAPTGDAELPEEYRRTLDTWVALASAAAVTTTLRLGSGIALVVEHDPIALAKQVATLDHLSGGRVVFGVGFGWNREEAEDHGVDWPARRAVTRERVKAMQSLWTEEVASFDGEFVHLSPSWAWPKPVQDHIPVLLGGAAGPILFEHIADYGDGWIPIGGAGLSESLPRLRDVWAEKGRDPSRLEVIPFGTVPTPGKLEHYANLGVTEVVVRIPGGGRDDVLRTLDRLASAAMFPT